MPWLAGLRHRVVLAYRLVCAREDARRRGLSLPAGAWLCDRCGFATWDQREFVQHCRVHST